MRKEIRNPEKEALISAAELLGRSFIQRKDIFASQLEDGRYVSVKEPLTDRHLVLHLEGHITLGTYMLATNNTTRLMAIDADGDNGLDELVNLARKLETENISAYLETSRRGGHLWFFFAQAQEGERVRAFGKGIMNIHKIEGVELFPKQDRLSGGPGSLVRLPFGKHKLTGQRYPFIHLNGDLLASTVREQIHILSDPQTVSKDALLAYSAHDVERNKHRVHHAFGEVTGSTEIERVKNMVSLMDFIGAYVDLHPVASGAVGRCPFHDDHHPSLGVNTEGNYWQCFAGCGGGTIIDFWMKWRDIDFPEAVSELAILLGVEK